MPALPQPTLPPGAQRELNDALHDLHHRAGWPSLRTLAGQAGCSHTTVSTAFSSPKLPTWGTLELLVEAMHGDTRGFHHLWLAASTPESSPATTTPRIAGRRDELATVRHHLETGTGLLLVTGEAGIGKTRLVDVAAAQTDVFVATGHCLPLSTEVPLMPVVDILHTVHDADGGHRLDEALHGSPPYVRRPLARLLPELDDGGAPALQDDEFARQHLFAAVARVLSRLHAQDGLALVVEDLHWADTSTLDLLEHLVAGSPGLPLVGTWRLDDLTVPPGHSEWLARVQRLPGTNHIDLGPLTPEETKEQLCLLSGERPDAAQAGEIHRRSRGHPMFTEHLAHQPEGAQLPRILSRVLDRSLDGMGEAAAAVVKMLGVADRGLPDAVIREATGLERGKLVAALHELDDRHLLDGDHQGNISLRHPLLAEAARRRLVPGEAGEEHRRLAVALASQATPDAAEVAEHWRQSGDLGEELRWLPVAARQAHLRTAPRAEATHWLRALEISSTAPTLVPDFDPVDARIQAFDALELAGQLDEAHRVIMEALVGVEDLDDLTAAEVLRRAAMAEALVARDNDAALELAERAIDRLGTHGATTCLVHTLEIQANELIDLGRFQEAMGALERALEACDTLGDDELFYGASATLAWQLAHLGDLESALQRLDDAHTRLPESAEPRREAYMAMMHTDALLLHHRPVDEIVRAAQRALDIARELDLQFHLLTMVRINVVEALLNSGHTRQAADLLTEIPGGVKYDQWPVGWMSARVAIAEGRLDEALDTLAELDAETPPYSKVELARFIAMAHLWAGQAALAWTALRPAIEAVLDSENVMDAGLAFGAAARAGADLAAHGAHRDAGRLQVTLTRFREQAVVDPLGPAPAPVSRRAATATWNAELARAQRGDRVELWSLAAQEWDALHSPHDAAYCRWRAAQVALREGQGSAAARLLARARRDAREHVPLTAAIDETAGYARAREQRA